MEKSGGSRRRRLGKCVSPYRFGPTVDPPETGATHDGYPAAVRHTATGDTAATRTTP